MRSISSIRGVVLVKTNALFIEDVRARLRLLIWSDEDEAIFHSGFVKPSDLHGGR